MVILGGAFAQFIGSMILGTYVFLFGLWLPAAALTVAWGTRNPNAPLLFMMILPTTGKWLAIISVILVLFGTQPALMAVFTAVPLLLSYLFASNKLPLFQWDSSHKPSSVYEKKRELDFLRYLNAVEEKKRERIEKERLKKLLESSPKEEDDRKE